MIFNSIKFTERPGERRQYGGPRFQVGQTLRLLYGDQLAALPGCRTMKRGRYAIVAVRESFATKVKGFMVYELVKFGSKYVFPIDTFAIDYFVDNGCIEVEE